jgi:hypothetical protein
MSQPTTQAITAADPWGAEIEVASEFLNALFDEQDTILWFIRRMRAQL